MWRVSACAERLMPVAACRVRSWWAGVVCSLVRCRRHPVYIVTAQPRQTGHYGRVVKATDSNSVRYLFPFGSAGSNPAGVVFF